MTQVVEKIAASGKRIPKTEPTVGGSTYVRPQDLEWSKTQFDKVWIKTLYEDSAKGESTVLIKLEPGAHLPFHKHPELEQAYVLEGSMYDHDGVCHSGEYVWRKAGSFHENRSDTGGRDSRCLPEAEHFHQWNGLPDSQDLRLKASVIMGAMLHA